MGYSLSRRDRDKVQRAVTNSRLSYASNVNYHRTYGGSGTDSYKGYFKAIDATDETGAKIRIVNGRSVSTPFCGHVEVGNQTIYVPATTFNVIAGTPSEPADDRIAVQVTYNEETSLYSASLISYRHGEPLDQGALYIVVSVYSYIAGVLSFDQTWKNDAMDHINGDYWT